jgi:N-acetylglutamate synthase-like GNAT family acetyltransferase
MQLRKATAADAEWINAAYQAVGFQPSDVEHELLIVAEVNGDHAGIGRLVPAGENACELGGMLVFDQYRHRGLARTIIDELLRHANGRTIYCIPFADLEPIYAKAGFVRFAGDEAALPEYVREKLAWCRSEIEREVILMTFDHSRIPSQSAASCEPRERRRPRSGQRLVR